MASPVRVRFAPSPTGPLHIGGVRTALYNYLFARKHGGALVLRIEDTDRSRLVPGAEQYILDSLKWCGIDFDEGVHIGGPFAPYRQSERKEIYREYVGSLIRSGHAYYAFDTPEALEELRRQLEESNAENKSYSVAVRQRMNNSLTLPPDEVERLISDGTPYVVRFLMPENETIRFHDIIRGEVEVSSNLLDDKVLFKSDGMPTYHLANVVDDYLMKITHVIRGEEWLPSLPLHVLLYRSFGWEREMPLFAHMPLTLKPDGKGKLSKRDGDRLGFPVFPLEWRNPVTGEFSSGYRESGYFPDAFINILAFLGWNPGTEQEFYSMEELIEAFSLERVGKSGSRFDPEKAKWYNHQYLIRKDNNELAALFLPIVMEKGFEPSPEHLTVIVGLVKERATFINDLWEQSHFFFRPPATYDQELVSKRWKEGTGATMLLLCDELKTVPSFTKEAIEATTKTFIEGSGLGTGHVLNALRLALVGSGTGPGIYDVMQVLGREEVILRIRNAVSQLK
ncbi:MAG: glutamate--tRNA ligase [Bacteroidales bacterium]|nr:glutamate--tRNA ligase [Bacteroidales bacterium]